MEKKLVYMDHGATTPVRSEVLQAMLPFLKDKYGNPSSLHAQGREIRLLIEEAREKTANALHAEPGEIYFTAGGTESNNMALRGAAKKHGKTGHIITTGIEHHAVFDVCHDLEKDGHSVTYLPVDRYGMIDLDQLEAAITPETFIISIMAANNEVGTIQPVKEIGLVAEKHGLLFHTDAVQLVGQLPINLKELNIDFLSLSAHKFNGPKGIGALYIKNKKTITPIYNGGGQEHKVRPGTENVPGIIGLAEALTLAVSEMEDKKRTITSLRDRLISGLLDIEEVTLNGHPGQRLPGNINVSFKHIEGEAVLLSLDLGGIAASSGSACSSGSLEPSHVLTAMGLEKAIAHGSVRFTLGYGNTVEDVDYALNTIPGIVDRLRKMSPTYRK